MSTKDTLPANREEFLRHMIDLAENDPYYMGTGTDELLTLAVSMVLALGHGQPVRNMKPS